MRKQITNYKIKTIKQITRQKSAALHVPVVQGSMQWCCALRGIFIFCFSFKISFMKKNAHWGAFWFCISYEISLIQKNAHWGAFWFFRFFLGRGVRSDAQLSSTETRFQKCSQSGKDGSKHTTLSTSMAYNVISCQKIRKSTQKIKIADFTM